jgi:hypothetical protein
VAGFGDDINKSLEHDPNFNGLLLIEGRLQWLVYLLRAPATFGQRRDTEEPGAMRRFCDGKESIQRSAVPSGASHIRRAESQFRDLLSEAARHI